MCLLIDHGLRVGEVAGLRVGDFDLEARTFTFYRPKVGKAQTHELTRDACAAAAAYFAAAAPTEPEAPLIRSSRKGGFLTHAGISTQKINARVPAPLLGHDRRQE
jgi:integrase